jgi:flagellin-like protein
MTLKITSLLKERDAVSPVVGVVLMVAVTVALATIVGVGVLGIGLPNDSSSGSPAVSVSQTGSGTYDIQVVQMNGADEVTVELSNGDTTSLSAVGDTASINLAQGESLTVLSSNGGSDEVVRTIDQTSSGAGSTGVAGTSTISSSGTVSPSAS